MKMCALTSSTTLVLNSKSESDFEDLNFEFIIIVVECRARQDEHFDSNFKSLSSLDNKFD
jgi:hypothetical protein